MNPPRVHSLTLRLALAAAIASSALALAQRAPVRREDAARLREKVDAVNRHAASPAGAPLLTRITEQEVNAYLALDAGDQIPTGLTDPTISIIGEGRLAGAVFLDLDAVRSQRKSRGWLDPMNYLSGRVSATVSGTLASADGLARFDLESAKLGGVPIPRALVQELLSYYSRTAANPRGLSLDEPYPLPARIRQIEVRPGEALIKQ